jgi:hypothetical protein
MVPRIYAPLSCKYKTVFLWLLYIQPDGSVSYISEICLMVCVMFKIINNVCCSSKEHMLVNVNLTMNAGL